MPLKVQDPKLCDVHSIINNIHWQSVHKCNAKTQIMSQGILTSIPLLAELNKKLFKDVVNKQPGKLIVPGTCLK